MTLDFFHRGLSPCGMMRHSSRVAVALIAMLSCTSIRAQSDPIDTDLGQTASASPTPAASVLEGGLGVNGTVYATLALPDGSVIIGGEFSNVNDTPRSNVAKILPDGTLDPAVFGKQTDGVNGTVYSLGVDSNGGILVGGYFSMAQEVERMNFVRYNADGSLDRAFGGSLQPSGPNGKVYAIAVQPDGRIVVAGEFTQIGIERRQNLARLNADGTPEGAANASTGVDGTVRALAVAPDGGVVVGGVFEIDGNNQRSITRLK